jgi:alpha-tubulin suppressor-like RCC1 family protein
MSERYPGGLIRKTPPTVTGPTDGEGGSAPGIWTLEEVAYYEKEGGWPKPIAAKSIFGAGEEIVGGFDSDRAPAVLFSSPVQVTSKTNWAKIYGQNSSYASFTHKHAIDQNGALWGWGRNLNGEIGNSANISTSSPVQVGALTTWDYVTTTNQGTYAIKTDGTIWSWGNGENGSLGHNNITNYNSPVQIGSDTGWTHISGGTQFALAIKNGGLYAWGKNHNGQLGLNSTQAASAGVSSPTQVGALTTWLTAVAGYYHSFAIKTDGTLWAWGSNHQGALGTNEAHTVRRSSPVQVGALTTWLKGDASYASSVFIKTDKTLWSWGGSSSYSSGHGDFTQRSSPVQVGSETWNEVSRGFTTMAVIRYDGTLWTCGDNSKGSTMQNTNTGSTQNLTQVGSDNTWLTLTAGQYSQFALKK